MSDPILPPNGGINNNPAPAGGVTPPAGSASPGESGSVTPPVNPSASVSAPGSLTPANPALLASSPGALQPVNPVPIGSAQQDALDAHMADMDNPHGVTADQVGAVSLEKLVSVTATKTVQDLRHGGYTTSNQVAAYWNSGDYDEVAGTLVDRLFGNVLTAQTKPIEDFAIQVGPSISSSERIDGVNPYGPLSGEDWSIKLNRFKFDSYGGAYGTSLFLIGTFGGSHGLAVGNGSFNFRDRGNTTGQLNMSYGSMDVSVENDLEFKRESGDFVLLINGVETARVTKAYAEFGFSQLRWGANLASGSLLTLGSYSIRVGSDETFYGFREGSGVATISSNGGLLKVPEKWVDDTHATGLSRDHLLVEQGLIGVARDLYDSNEEGIELDLEYYDSLIDQVIINYKNAEDYEIIILKNPDADFADAIRNAWQTQEKIIVPVIYATGQSLALGSTSFSDLSLAQDQVRGVPFAFASSDSNNSYIPDLSPLIFSDMGEATGTVVMGSIHQVVANILSSDWRAGYPAHLRLAVVLSGGGGQTARLWDFGGSNPAHFDQLTNAVDTLTTSMNARYAEADYSLSLGIINQGESNAGQSNGVEWRPSWVAFKSAMDVQYGKVNHIVEALAPNVMNDPDPNSTVDTASRPHTPVVRAAQELLIADFGNVYLSDPNTIDLNIYPASTLTYDYVHPTRKGYELWGDLSYAAIINNDLLK